MEANILMQHPGYQLSRVKVWKLQDESWADQGTGHLVVDSAEPLKFLIVSEDDNETVIYIHQVSRDESYQRSGGKWRSGRGDRSIVRQWGQIIVCGALGAPRRRRPAPELHRLYVGRRFR